MERTTLNPPDELPQARLAHPRFVLPVLRLVHRMVGRGSPPEQVSGVAVLPLLALGGFALAWTVGFVAAGLLVVTPAGLGIREVALLMVLGPVVAGISVRGRPRADGVEATQTGRLRPVQR